MENVAYSLEILRTTRNNVIQLMDSLSYKELTTIPVGFNNSILWNAVHNLAVQQALCYKLSQLPMHIPNKFVEGYTKGATGKSVILESEIDELKSLMMSTIDLFAEDYQANKFVTYTTYTTSYNITLKSVEDAINFNNTHEGLHFGYMMALKRAL